MSYDDDDDDDDYSPVTNLTKLERVCLLLRRNNIETCSIPFDYPSRRSFTHDLFDVYDDSFALILAGSLIRNTSLKELSILLDEALFSELSIRVLAKGILRSELEVLLLTDGIHHPREVFHHVPSEVVRSFYLDMIQSKTIRTLRIAFTLGNTDITRLGAALQHGSDDDHRGLYFQHYHLRHLCLDLMFVTSRSAVRILCEGLRNSRNKVSKLELTSVSPEVCRFLVAEGILNIEKLCNLNVDEQWYGEDEISDLEDDDDEAVCYEVSTLPLEVPPIKITPKLETLTLSNCGLDDTDLQRVATDIRNHYNLKNLYLDDNCIGIEGIQCLVESWKRESSSSSSSSTQQLEELSLQRNNFGADGLHQLLKALQTYPSLKILHLCNNPHIGNDFSDDTADAENEQTGGDMYSIHLEELSLAACNIDVLPTILFCNSSIQLLDLDRNCINDAGAATLVEWMNVGLNNRFERINLSYNCIEVVGMRHLIQASGQYPFLTSLDISSSDDDSIAYKDLVGIAQDLIHSKLSMLDLNVCQHDLVASKDETKQAILDNNAEKEAACQALVSSVKSNMYLEYLNHMGLPAMVEYQIQFYLKLNKFGRRNLLQNEELQQPALWSHVFAKCQGDASVLFYLLREKQPTLLASGAGIKRRNECTITPNKKRQTKTPDDL